MNKIAVVGPNSVETVAKETFHIKKKSGPSRESQSEAQNEEADKGQGHYSKITSHFDYSNLGLFFRGRPNQMKGNTENVITKVHNKKKSNETISCKEGALRHTSSKDYSNLEELYENTTIINNPNETIHQSTKKSNDINSGKTLIDENQDMYLENTLFKNHNKKESREKSLNSVLKAQKEEKLDQEIVNDISKLGLDNLDEQEKSESNMKDTKTTKSNIKVIERIKTKALPNRPIFNPHITSETPKSTQFEFRSNPNDLSAGPSFSKLTKAISPFLSNYLERDLDENENEQEKFINDLFENPTKSSNPISLEKCQKNSQENLNPVLLTEKTTNKISQNTAEITLDSARDSRQQPNLSLISTDSTLDSENLALAQDHHNNSFSTPFSGASGSFNTSAKFEFSSPIRVDSGRINSESSELNYMKNYSMQNNMNLVSSRIPIMPPLQTISTNLNQSCMTFCGGYGSGNNSDRSTNLSFGEEYLNNAFTNTFSTPQSRQHSYHNQSFNASSNSNIMEQFFIPPQSLDPNYISSGSYNQNMNQSTSSSQNKASLQSGKSNNANVNDSKNSGRARRRNQEGDEGNLYDIDVNKIEATGRTTLMIRNIPNKYDLTLILQTIDKNHKGKFDFFYLPIDFSNRCNFGYAFINFTNAKYIKDFYLEFNGKKMGKVQ